MTVYLGKMSRHHAAKLLCRTNLHGLCLSQLAMSGMAAPSEGSFGEGGGQGPCTSVRESSHHSGGGVHPQMEGQESHRRAYTDDAQVIVFRETFSALVTIS